MLKWLSPWFYYYLANFVFKRVTLNAKAYCTLNISFLVLIKSITQREKEMIKNLIA